MDTDSNTRTTEQISSEPTYIYHQQGATDAVAPQPTFASGSVTWTPHPHLDSQRRVNLRQASVALDTAYERINTLRNSINSMLNRVPPEAAGTGIAPTNNTDINDTQPHPSLGHDASIRPPHSAIVLSGEQVVEELNLRAARLRSLISPSARQRLEEFESSGASRESVWDRFAQQGDRPRLDRSNLLPDPPRLRTPPMPDLVLPRHDPRAAQRRDLQSAHRDDSSTMIGRRVAARVNASDGHGSLSSRLSFSQIEQRLQAQTAQVARELENMTERLAASRSRRVELASRIRSVNAAAAGQENGTTRSPLTPASGDTRLVSDSPAGGRLPIPAVDVSLVNAPAHIVPPQQISRTSSDGTPINGLETAAHRSISAALRGHIATYRDHVHVANTSQDTPRNLANSPDVRGTLVSLLARDRDEQLLSSRRDDTSARSNPSSPAGRGRRRRGWTRLNADGDSIDSDEDDNVSPHTRRLRMRFSYGAPNVDRSATRSHTVAIEDILWRTSGSDSEADALSPDATESCQSLLQGSPPRPSVRRPHPLPTPVEDMLIYPAVKPPQRPRVVCVSKYASLAGR